nr:type II toxin-antitoxin system PemK/MazF family toxin [uncultured Devosia sp.]
MPTFDFGDTVVVPFPFVDLPLAKHRPSVVLSSGRFNVDSGQSIMAMITTARRSIWPSDVPITDLNSAGLMQPSVIRFKLFTLPNDLLLRPLGKLAASDQARMIEIMKSVFG